MGVDNIRNEMDSQNDEGAHGDDASRVAAFDGWRRHYEGSWGRGEKIGGLYQARTALDHPEYDMKPE